MISGFFFTLLIAAPLIEVVSVAIIKQLQPIDAYNKGVIIYSEDRDDRCGLDMLLFKAVMIIDADQVRKTI
jgi:hypothetical protein